MTKPKFSFRLLNFGIHAEREAMINQAKLGDDCGYDSIWVSDRLLVPFPPNQPWSQRSPLFFDTLTVLSYVAGITSRVRLGTYVLITPLRNPLILAREVATLDIFSKGRMILGLGLGWMKEEFDASNIPLKQRAIRTDETISILRVLWTKEKPSYEGKFTTFGEVLFEPKPIQRHLPIWIGGETIPALKRVARIGDGWLPIQVNDSATMKNSINIIRQEVKNVARSIDEITLTHRIKMESGHLNRSAMLKKIEEMRELGIDYFMVDVEPRSASDYGRNLELFCSEIMNSY